MINSDVSEFYIGEQPPKTIIIKLDKFAHDSGSQRIIDQNDQTSKIGLNENQEIEKCEHKKTVKILPDCPLKLVNIKFVNLKLVKIANHHGRPNFRFEINGKAYFYGIRGIKADYKIVLFSTKTFPNNAYILPTECLKKIIRNSPKYSTYPKILDKSDPRVYDIII
jgi:hypothetical protein